MTLRVLLLTDDGERLAPLAAAFRAAGCEVVISAPGPGAPEAEADLVMTDPMMAPATLEAAERRHITAMLRHTRGNKRQAAHLLGIARSTLLAKVRRYGLDGIGRSVDGAGGDPAP